MTSRSFSNSFNIPFLFFYALVLVFILIFISFAYYFSHPFDVYLNHVLFTLRASIVCDIQFHFLTRSIMTSPFYSNSFNMLFLFFSLPFLDVLIWFSFCYWIVLVYVLLSYIRTGSLVYVLLFYLCGGSVGIRFVI